MLKKPPKPPSRLEVKLKPIFQPRVVPRVGYKLYDTVSARVDHKRVKKEVELPERPLTTLSMPQLERTRLSPEGQLA